MKKPDILNDPQYKYLADIIRENKEQCYAATELAFIYRYIDGEKELKDNFSIVNYTMVKSLLKNLK